MKFKWWELFVMNAWENNNNNNFSLCKKNTKVGWFASQIAGKLVVAGQDKGYITTFQKILDVINLKFYESENFSDSSFHRIFKSEHLSFLFLRKIA